MAFTNEELERYRNIVNAYIEKRRPPVHLREQVDLSFRIQNQSIEIYEIRPGFNDPQRKVEIPVAKTTWVRTQKVWRVFWQRADMKWHRYPPLPEVKSLEEFIDAVEVDEHACFYGESTRILCPQFVLDSLATVVVLGVVSFAEGRANEIEDRDGSNNPSGDGERDKRPGEVAPMPLFH